MAEEDRFTRARRAMTSNRAYQDTGSTKPSRPPGQPSSGPHIGYGGNQVNIGTQTEPNQVNVGYGGGQVDPGLAAAVLTQNNPGTTPQEANQIVQSGMGSTGVGFGIGSLPPVATTTTDGTGITGITDGTTTTDDTTPTDDENEETYRAFVNNQIQPKKLSFWMKKTGATSYRILSDGRIVLTDKITGRHWIMNLAGGLNEIGAEMTGFKPEKAFGDMGDQGKAALYNKISKMDPDEFRAFLNRKGNLDRIMSYYEGSGVSRGNIDEILKTGDVQGFANLIKGGGGEGFDKALQKMQYPQQYWNENPPRTSAEAEEAAMAGISWIEDYGPVERPEGHWSTEGLAGLGGGAAVSGIAGISPLPGLVEDNLANQTFQPALPDVVLGYGPGDQPYTTVIPQEGYQYAYDQEGNRYSIPIGGDQSGETSGGRPFTWRPTETAQTPATTPTPFGYSQWPQFTSAYPGHYSNWGAPSYAANGGIVSQARPQYDYWNRIANAYPGMR